MKVAGQQNSLKSQLAQAVKAAMQLNPGAAGSTAESDALLKEFSDVMDKIAAKLKESSPKGKLIGFNDFGVGEMDALSSLAPKAQEVKPQTEAQVEDNAQSEEPVEAAADAEARASKVQDKSEVKCDKPLDQKAQPEAVKVKSDKKDEVSDEEVKSLVKEGVQVLSAKPSDASAKPAVEKVAQDAAPEAVGPVDAAKAALPVEGKVEVKPEAKVTDTAQKVQSAKSQETKPQDLRAEAIAQDAEMKQEPVSAAADSQIVAPKVDAMNVQPQAQIKLAEVFSAEIARIRADVSIGRVSVERDSSISSAVKQSSDVASKINNQVGAASARSNSFGSDSSFAKPFENLSHAEAPRALRPLNQAASSRTMEKVENALKEAAKSRDGKTISLRLDPPELGSVKIDISMRDGNLHARLVAESPAVNQLLRDKAHDLQAALRKLGLHVDTVSVSVSNNEEKSTGNQQAFSQQKTDRDAKFSGSLGSMVSGPHGRETVSAVEDHWIA